MGMSASQARLLQLTCRLTDVEFKAQNIQSQKIALATQKDEVYQKYCDALDAKIIKVAYWNGDATTKLVNANFNSLCSYNENRCKQYCLKNNRTGNIIVSEEAKDMFETFGKDKYAFAYAMLGFDGSYGWSNPTQGSEIGIGTAENDYGYYSESGTGYSLYMTECEQNVYNKYSTGELADAELIEKYQEIIDAQNDKDRANSLKEFRDYLYSKTEYKTDIFNEMNLNKQDSKEYTQPYSDETWDDIKNEFNYYINLWTAIKEAGGCEAIDPEYDSGDTGDDWFNNMVNAGLVGIQVYDDSGSKNAWSETSIATSTNENYLEEQQDDTDLKKAEAEYEYQLGIISNKDKKFDTELSKLETERTAIKTEIDSIKTVRDDNIDRTFGIFG